MSALRLAAGAREALVDRVEVRNLRLRPVAAGRWPLPTFSTFGLTVEAKLGAALLFVGSDCTENHHDAEIVDEQGRRLARRRLPEGWTESLASYIRFETTMPNETWQSDFTHYRLTRPDGRPGADVEIISWLDDCTR